MKEIDTIAARIILIPFRIENRDKVIDESFYRDRIRESRIMWLKEPETKTGNSVMDPE